MSKVNSLKNEKKDSVEITEALILLSFFSHQGVKPALHIAASYQYLFTALQKTYNDKIKQKKKYLPNGLVNQALKLIFH
ncbi:hypothetical protein [Coleofasciculus sp. FACHB-1120]|uniref:hypothetical protein n=1 Tax=Coleofasciculus sp. FACHB-1120 TaxID=2692783 RepID=UPI001683EED9|nr:hypothetical protein [Coleofasciculus sp. FACHB-1120]MBD2742566.1 hypothetical protein [Coleofasciculus sp. FACHB-1120]